MGDDRLRALTSAADMAPLTRDEARAMLGRRNPHADFFADNLLAIRAAERLALKRRVDRLPRWVRRLRVQRSIRRLRKAGLQQPRWLVREVDGTFHFEDLD